jgi:uncharacterized protein YllA (UPF0747 family)
MQVTTVPWSRLDPGNDVARAYLADPPRTLPLFACDYRDPRALRPLLDARRDRPRLGAILERYNREVGGSPENAARLDDGFCVVSGQQAGLLLGPAYTTYKLFTAIRAARVLERELKVPVVPVFWAESEDHDWEEVNRFFWGDRRYRLEVEVAPGTPVGRVEADPGPFLAEVKAALREGDAWEVVEPERNVARWHVRSLARLVKGEGVVFLEPSLLREPMRPLAERIAADADRIDASLLRETGFERELAPPDGAYLFDNGGARKRLARGAKLPAQWSTDVVSRVLVQNAALPALAAVCGPGEIRYWSQLKGAHEALGIPMPAVLPRASATLVEEGIARDASKLGLDLEEVVRGVAKQKEPGAEDPVAARLRRLATEAADLEGARLDLPPNTERPFRKTVERLREELQKLALRIEDARAEAQGAGRRHYERILRELRPRGGLQERTHSLFPYLLRHGTALARDLRESFDPFESGHYLVRL